PFRSAGDRTGRQHPPALARGQGHQDTRLRNPDLDAGRTRRIRSERLCDWPLVRRPVHRLLGLVPIRHTNESRGIGWSGLTRNCSAVAEGAGYGGRLNCRKQNQDIYSERRAPRQGTQASVTRNIDAYIRQSQCDPYEHQRYQPVVIRLGKQGEQDRGIKEWQAFEQVLLRRVGPGPPAFKLVEPRTRIVIVVGFAARLGRTRSHDRQNAGNQHDPGNRRSHQYSRRKALTWLALL